MFWVGLEERKGGIGAGKKVLCRSFFAQFTSKRLKQLHIMVLGTGKKLLVKFTTVGPGEGNKRQVFFDVNGMPRSLFVEDKADTVSLSFGAEGCSILSFRNLPCFTRTTNFTEGLWQGCQAEEYP